MAISAFAVEDLPPLLDLLYGAALDNDQWPMFLQGLMKPFDGENGVLHFFDIASQVAPNAHPPGLEGEHLISFQEHYSTINRHPIQMFAKRPPLQVMPGTTVLGKDAALQTEFYNDWIKHQDVSPGHLACMVHKDDREMVVLAIAPSPKKRARNSDRYTKQFELLLPHLRRAFAISKASRAAPAQARVLPAQFACGAMLIARNRAVKVVNPPAESFLREGRLLSVDSLGKLRAKDGEVHAGLVAAMDAVFGRYEPVGGPVYCRMPGSRVSFVILKQPKTDSELALVLVITKPNASENNFPAQFTAAEARLATALLNGQSLSDFSEQVGVSINTARKQLSALFAKTGTNRQAALVAWLLQRNS